jgi:quinohemoprotein ethanol dehydrogenase
MNRSWTAAMAIAMTLGVSVAITATPTAAQPDPAARYLDSSDGADWPGYGRTFGEQHYSPLTQINRATVGRLGLVSFRDLDAINTATQPIAVDGVVYFGAGFSVVHAVEARTGKLLWKFDPKAPGKSGPGLRIGWGSRGIAWWNGKIYTGTHDGRLIAIDAKTGKELWAAQTFDPKEPWYISGAPRIFDGKVVVGFGSDIGKVRGYVTAYDAETGKQAWRFYTVPGNPAIDTDETTKMAAGSWAGEWWKYGGGGTVWNAMSYDPELGLLYLGTGNGWPWNRKLRSAGQGDNLFLSSIVALDAKTGRYRWHYQVDPGDTWDYNSAMDVELADLDIGGVARKVLMTAPKNGHLYVIDRATGQFISAKPYEKVSWGSVDPVSGRPIRHPDAFFENGRKFELWPSSAGAHSWPPMAFSPKTNLVYIPAIHMGFVISDPADLFTRDPGAGNIAGATVAIEVAVDGHSPSGSLVAWDPVSQKQVWRVEYPTPANGGVMVTAGGLVFQGTVDGKVRGYDAADGKLVWSYDAGTPILAPPISYLAGGTQYVSILTGLGTTMAAWGPMIEKFGVDPSTQKRRLLTFALGGEVTLPRTNVAPRPFPADPDFTPDPARAMAGMAHYLAHCVLCHGMEAVSATHAPDLRRSPVPFSAEAFTAVVRDGVLRDNGMAAYSDLTPEQIADIRHYIRTAAHAARAAEGASAR